MYSSLSIKMCGIYIRILKYRKIKIVLEELPYVRVNLINFECNALGTFIFSETLFKEGSSKKEV
ncbi:MAG: hypothetical protein NTX05_04365 [Fusobacteria bacterium]|nr:hypothetical protein [Fusobacteriota bacterium]